MKKRFHCAGGWWVVGRIYILAFRIISNPSIDILELFGVWSGSGTILKSV